MNYHKRPGPQPTHIFQGHAMRWILAGVILLASVPALAQVPEDEIKEEEQPTAEQEGATEDVRRAVDDEIVVTARRREEKLQEVPISVSVVSGETLQDIKADARFADFALVRMARLSVMPVPAPLWKRLLTMAGEKP